MVKYLLEPQYLSFDLELSPEKGRLSRYLKTGNREALESYIEEGLKLGNRLADARATYSITENSQDLIENYGFPEPLHEAESLVFGISTIGEALEKKVDTLMEEGNYTLSNILDSIGSAAVDETTDHLGEEVMNYARENELNTTRAFQPGSGASHWKVKNHKVIFEQLHPEKLGVNLTSSFTIIPKKSTSFVIGLAGDIVQVEDLFSCVGCERTDCPYRHTPEKTSAGGQGRGVTK